MVHLQAKGYLGKHADVNPDGCWQGSFSLRLPQALAVRTENFRFCNDCCGTGVPSHNVEQLVETEGIDIMIALDVSSSMLAQDFKPGRLEAAKEIAIQFVSGRRNDRIGLVVFAGESFTMCPLTTDLRTVVNSLRM